MLSAGFLIDTMAHGDAGFSKVCSLGNKVDVNECEILEYLLSDPGTNTVGLYLESFADGRRFMDLCARTDKPVVVLKGGKSDAGARAAMSHTASLTGNQTVVSGALAQAGVMEATDFKEMIDLCRGLAAQPIRINPKGRIAVLTYTAAGGIVSADFMADTGLKPASLSKDTLEANEIHEKPQLCPAEKQCQRTAHQ